jgi:hypothetical protein
MKVVRKELARRFGAGIFLTRRHIMLRRLTLLFIIAVLIIAAFANATMAPVVVALS